MFSAEVSRREFLKGLFASMGLVALGPSGRLFAAPEGWKAPGEPELVFGVLADTHLRTSYSGRSPGKLWPTAYLRAALAYFRDAGVDAVMHCGDFAHRGQVAELQFHADIWKKTFAGRPEPVKLFATGNHDVSGATYGGFVKKVWPDEEERAKHIFANDIAGHWERIWGEKYEGVWHKEVKGYHFFGRHYEIPVAAMQEMVLAKAGELGLKGTKPFFIVQHRIPPKGQRDALRAFPNAMAFFGHWHITNADWRTVILNKFPAIQCGACRPAGENWFTDKGIGKAPLQGKEDWAPSREGLVVKVYSDMIVIERREFGVSGGEKTGSDWVMPIGQYRPHPLSEAALKEKIGVPEFPAGAKLKATICMAPVQTATAAERPDDAETFDNADDAPQSAARTEEKALKISIPRADGNPASRAYAFDVVVAGDVGGAKLFKSVYARGANLAPGEEPDGGVTSLVVRLSELPEGENLTFAVRPVTSLKTAGAPITAKLSFDKLKRRHLA